MIGVYISQREIDFLIRDLRKLGKIIGSPNLQMYRAEQFRKFTVKEVVGNHIGLKKLSNATIKLTGAHAPLSLSGRLMNNMKVRKAPKNAADVGYFDNDMTQVPGTKITYTKLARLQHTGYRIKITGKKGQKVLAWLHSQGVFDGNPSGTTLKKGEGWINVPARPFMLKAMNKYEAKGLDMKATDQFLKNLSDTPSGEKSV